MLGRGDPQFCENFLDMPGTMPIPMQTAAPSKQERRAAAAIHFLGKLREVSKCDPGVSVGIRNCQDPSTTVDGHIVAMLREREQPCVTLHEFNAVLSIRSNFLGRCSRIERAEQCNQIVSCEARWIHRPRGTDQFEVRYAEFQTRLGHG